MLLFFLIANALSICDECVVNDGVLVNVLPYSKLIVIPKFIINFKEGTRYAYVFMNVKDILTNIFFEENSELVSISDYAFYECSKSVRKLT